MEESEDLGSTTKGKRWEFIIIGKLLEKGFSVYLPAVDTGIDCLVGSGDGNYKEIQIKYREDRGVFSVRNFQPRKNYYIVCVLSTRYEDDLWVIPSGVFSKLGHPGKEDSFQLTIGKPGSDTYETLRAYRSNFEELLSGASHEVRRTVEQVSKKIEGAHFKQSDYEREVLAILSQEPNPLRAKEIVGKLRERMRDRFSKADLEVTKGNIPRWVKTARFAIFQGLKRQGLIEPKAKNQYVITPKGREYLAKNQVWRM